MTVDEVKGRRKGLSGGQILSSRPQMKMRCAVQTDGRMNALVNFPNEKKGFVSYMASQQTGTSKARSLCRVGTSISLSDKKIEEY